MNETKDRINTFFQYKDLLRELVVRDVKLKYRRSFLGYLWSILNPLLIMIVMTLVFSQMFRQGIENYPVYLLAGQTLFDFMNSSTHMSMYSVLDNSSLIKKIYVPKYIFTLSKVTSSLIDLIFSMGALVIVMLFTRSHFSPYILLFPLVIIPLYIFVCGMGFLLSAANVFFRDIQYIYNAVTTAWLYLTPIFYPIESLPPRLIWIVKHLNPMYFYIGQFRDIICYNRFPGHIIILAGCTASVLMLIIGTWSFLKNQDQFILYI